jgi:tetratricopeptide (TPR) repeat protein
MATIEVIDSDEEELAIATSKLSIDAGVATSSSFAQTADTDVVHAPEAMYGDEDDEEDEDEFADAAAQPGGDHRDDRERDHSDVPGPAALGPPDGEPLYDDAYFDNLPKDSARALEAKERGNKHFSKGEYEQALDSYAEALLTVPDEDVPGRLVYHSNKAAAHYMLHQWEDVVYECSQCLALDPDYVKALVRRGKAHEKQDRLSEAVEDYKRAVELDPRERELARRLPELEKEVAARFEKQKDEMLDKLKGFGNTILGKFGMSLDQFKAVKDPNTGSYSISFGNSAPAEGAPAEGAPADGGR